MADAMVMLLGQVDRRLGGAGPRDVIDVGAGDGAILDGMARGLANTDLGRRTRLIGIDVRPRPEGLLPAVQWVQGDGLACLPLDVIGLVMAHEWLDEIPLDVVERDADGIDRLVLVDEDGRECRGEPVDGATAEWLARWWPLSAPGDRAEVGLSRDAAWRRLCDAVRAGTVLATDYGHERLSRRPTLRAYRRGAIVDAVPDGSCNITAHVAVDSCLAAGPGQGAVVSQREALGELDLVGLLPSPSAEPAEYARALARSWEVRSLRSPGGLGSFHWLRADIG